MKQIFGKGLFIRNDENGNPCRIGDVVKVTRSAMSFSGRKYEEDGWVNIDEQSWSGILCLLKSKGVMVRFSRGYVKPNITNLGLAKWKWELITDMNEREN